MKSRWFAVLGVASVAACAMKPLYDDSAHQISISGKTYVINQLTASTWTASTFGKTNPLVDESTRTALLQAIEKTSGCKVTDTDYLPHAGQLNAQVDCGSRTKN